MKVTGAATGRGKEAVAMKFRLNDLLYPRTGCARILAGVKAECVAPGVPGRE